MTIPLALLIFIMSFNVSPARAAEDPAKYIRIGLYWGEKALPSANLLNFVGSGYSFGYF